MFEWYRRVAITAVTVPSYLSPPPGARTRTRPPCIAGNPSPSPSPSPGNEGGELPEHVATAPLQELLRNWDTARTDRLIQQIEVRGFTY